MTKPLTPQEVDVILNPPKVYLGGVYIGEASKPIELLPPRR